MRLGKDKIKRIVSRFLLPVYILIAISGLFSFSASAESLYIHKIVSVVYDDSGSMLSDDKYINASYAMQTFCGMLNEEDQLYVTYMSECDESMVPQSHRVDLSSGNIQTSIDAFSSHNSKGNTPFQAFQTAFETLESVSDNNPNTQYWLVMFTDGGNFERSYLDDQFKRMCRTQMPNGTTPQLTYLAIGKGTNSPTQSESIGLYTYATEDSDGIIKTMSDIADRISGRTRLDASDINKVNDKTLKITSAIPLLNIVTFVQNSDAKLTKVNYNNESDVPIVRTASLHSGSLKGGTFLAGDSQKAIGSGDYTLTFDKSIDKSNVVILLEPALEIKMELTLNGKTIKDYSELDSAMETDKVGVSCKICEMGTDTEISPSLLPSGTTYSINITEDGKVVKTVSGSEMKLDAYELKNIETEISASVTIKGFNPIKKEVSFKPLVYVPPVIYTITAAYGGSSDTVFYDDLSSNKDFTIQFTVFADGVALTDKAAVEALHPEVKSEPDGNNGTLEITDDGKIVFTPLSAASAGEVQGNTFSVKVSCTVDGGASADIAYNVRISEYEVVSTNADKAVKKTELFGNTKSVSFYVLKDGQKLGRSDVEGHFTVTADEKHGELTLDVQTSSDGTVTVTPHSEKEYKLYWPVNWFNYFRISSEDIEIKFAHDFKSATASIEVSEESVVYQLLNVYLPLILEIAIVIVLAIYIYIVVTKPRFAKGAVIYAGTIRFNETDNTHILRDFTPVKLEKYNALFGYGRLKFKKQADPVIAGGIKIRADYNGRIICEEALPWYKNHITPIDSDVQVKTPADISTYLERNSKLEINEFSTTETISGENRRSMIMSSSRLPFYYVVPEPGAGVKIIDDRKVIKYGKIFIYTTQN